jgi:2-polyprenyl-3-methyl-5-hydroxy-6-metoxy-1,4-benzoquinol methylase
MDLIKELAPSVNVPYNTYEDHKRLFNRIVNSYDSLLIRSYCKVRFTIININILHILSLCLRGKQRVLDIGCGFGLFGCYFSALNPNLEYTGYDLNPKRIDMANETARRLGLKNTRFYCQDARTLSIDEKYDAIMMIDLLHHLGDRSKEELLAKSVQHLAPGGRLVIKDVTTRPFFKIAFTWALDVVMTRGFDMWYWDESRFCNTLGDYFHNIEIYPLNDWMPYPHIVYLMETA